MTTNHPQRPECPRCGSDDVLPIGYGLVILPVPSDERGRPKFVPGGCAVSDASLRWCCGACNHRW